jgi:hypothetical protein
MMTVDPLMTVDSRMIVLPPDYNNLLHAPLS